MDPIVDPVRGLPLWTTPNFEDEFYERSKLILRTLNGQNCVNKLYFLSGFWSPHIKRLFQFFLNSIPKEWKRSREEVVFLCSFSVSLCCMTTQQLCKRLGQEEIKHADWVPSSDFPFLDQALGNVCLSANSLNTPFGMDQAQNDNLFSKTWFVRHLTSFADIHM